MVIRGALARVMGHGEHSLSPNRAVDRNRGSVKTHHAAQAHVLRPFDGLARVGNTFGHGITHDSETLKDTTGPYRYADSLQYTVVK